MKTYMLDLSACDVWEIRKTFFGECLMEIPCGVNDSEQWEFYVLPGMVPLGVMDGWRRKSGQVRPGLKLGFNFTDLPDGAAMQIVQVVEHIVVESGESNEVSQTIDALQQGLDKLRKKLYPGMVE